MMVNKIQHYTFNYEIHKILQPLMSHNILSEAYLGLLETRFEERTFKCEHKFKLEYTLLM